MRVFPDQVLSSGLQLPFLQPAYQEKYPEFVDRKAALKEKMILKARSVVNDALENKDLQTAQWYLERKRKDEFSARSEHTGADGNAIETKVNLNLNPEEAYQDMLKK